jgi:hypothetical protein
MDQLSHLRSAKSIRASLSELPTTLNATYKNILKRVQQQDVDLLRKALFWTAFSVLPLKIDELQDALAIEVGMLTLAEVEDSRLLDASDILSLSNGLFTVSDTGHVKLAHLSVLDYLLSADIKDDPEVCGFSIDPKDARREMAASCLTYLCLQNLGTGPVESQDEWKERVASQPLLRHAATGWTYYLREAKPDPELNWQVTSFFSADSRPTFMSWIQILNSRWIFKATEYPRHATPLYYASSFGLVEVVEQLVQDGAILDSPGSRFGGTALHGATLREHTAVMRLLLEAGANPSQTDFNQVAPLHTAARIGNAEVLNLLLEFGAAKDTPDSLGETPCNWAVQSGKEASLRLLLGKKYGYSQDLPSTPGSPIYERPVASFPALAVAQGLGFPTCNSNATRPTGAGLVSFD